MSESSMPTYEIEFYEDEGGHEPVLILLLSGYDKAEHSSKPHQNAQIEEARRLLRHWKEREKKRR